LKENYFEEDNKLGYLEILQLVSKKPNLTKTYNYKLRRTKIIFLKLIMNMTHGLFTRRRRRNGENI